MSECATVQVPAGRLAGWLERFSARHGSVDARWHDGVLALAASDGATAEVSVGWAPVPDPGEDDPVLAALAHVRRPRTVGALLVRKQAHAVGLFEDARLVASRLGSHYVQGRTKAGGWSQQRYARRRDNQATRSFRKAADDAADVLLPRISELDVLLCGGDRGAVEEVLGDDRLEALRVRYEASGRRVAGVPDPKRPVLESLPERLLVVDIVLNAAARA